MPSITTSTGVGLHYAETGSGRPIVFLHGWAMSGRVWRFQEELSPSGRLLFPDQRGHGQSAPGPSYAVEDFAQDLASFFEILDLRDAVLVGWSMGVQIAIEAFPGIKGRLAALVLVAGTPRFTATGGYPHGKPAIEVKGLGVRLRRDHHKTMGEFFRGMFVDGEMDQKQYQRIVHEIIMGGHAPDTEAALKSLMILSQVDLRDRLATMEVPVLLVHGDGDTICPASASGYMAQRFPQVTLKIMEGCGHAPFMTRPQEFNGLVRDFLEDTLSRAAVKD